MNGTLIPNQELCHLLSCLIHQTTFCGKYYNYHHFKDEEMEYQKVHTTGSSLSWKSKVPHLFFSSIPSLEHGQIQSQEDTFLLKTHDRQPQMSLPRCLLLLRSVQFMLLFYNNPFKHAPLSNTTSTCLSDNHASCFKGKSN